MFWKKYKILIIVILVIFLLFIFLQNTGDSKKINKYKEDTQEEIKNSYLTENTKSELIDELDQIEKYYDDRDFVGFQNEKKKLEQTIKSIKLDISI